MDSVRVRREQIANSTTFDVNSVLTLMFPGPNEHGACERRVRHLRRPRAGGLAGPRLHGDDHVDHVQELDIEFDDDVDAQGDDVLELHDCVERAASSSSTGVAYLRRRRRAPSAVWARRPRRSSTRAAAMRRRRQCGSRGNTAASPANPSETPPTRRPDGSGSAEPAVHGREHRLGLARRGGARAPAARSTSALGDAASDFQDISGRIHQHGREPI